MPQPLEHLAFARNARGNAHSTGDLRQVLGVGSTDGRNSFVTEGSEGEQHERLQRGARWIEFEPPVIRNVRIERNARLM